MSEVFFISDLHLNHRGLKKFVPWIANMTHEEYIETLIARWNSVVHRGDIVWVLGDISKNSQGLVHITRLNGNKNLVLGNHDNLHSLAYLRFFNNVFGIIKKYHYWISHAPIHPIELRGYKNIHGHVHQNELVDQNYIYVGADKLEGYPINLEEIRKK